MLKTWRCALCQIDIYFEKFILDQRDDSNIWSRFFPLYRIGKANFQGKVLNQINYWNIWTKWINEQINELEKYIIQTLVQLLTETLYCYNSIVYIGSISQYSHHSKELIVSIFRKIAVSWNYNANLFFCR